MPAFNVLKRIKIRQGGKFQVLPSELPPALPIGPQIRALIRELGYASYSEAGEVMHSRTGVARTSLHRALEGDCTEELLARILRGLGATEAQFIKATPIEGDRLHPSGRPPGRRRNKRGS